MDTLSSVTGPSMPTCGWSFLASTNNLRKIAIDGPLRALPVGSNIRDRHTVTLILRWLFLPGGASSCWACDGRTNEAGCLNGVVFCPPIAMKFQRDFLENQNQIG